MSTRTSARLLHRHPILLVDRLVQLQPFERIIAEKAVSGSEPCYAGMRDGLPTRAYAYPASLLLESFGQTGALLWLESLRSTGRAVPDGTLIFAAARDVVFHRPVLPGDVVRHVGRLERSSSVIALSSAGSPGRRRPGHHRRQRNRCASPERVPRAGSPLPKPAPPPRQPPDRQTA